MKKLTVLFLMIFVIATAHSQNYQINFAGTGASSTVDSVQVQNLTQCKTVSLSSGYDTLFLSATYGINTLVPGTASALHIYPNPMTGYCLIDFYATAQGETTIELYDIAGKRITQVQDFLTKGQHTYSLSGLGSGIYILKVETLYATSSQYEYSAKIVSVNLTSGIPEITHIEAAPIRDSINVSHLENVKHLIKGNKSLINMQYTKGDTLKLTGFSGIYTTVFMLVPTKSQTVTFNFIACTDGDNNNYAVVQIGTQTWMEKNLKTTKYNDGDTIPNVTDSTAWGKLSTPGYCWYNDSIKYKNIYGALYNWFAVNTGKLCPTGWHVPDTTEWNTLVNYLGGESIAGGKMKEACSTHWLSPNAGATNSNGFTALPGGGRSSYHGSFHGLGINGDWWSATEYNATYAWYCYLYYVDPDAGLSSLNEQLGFSVRCLKDY